MEYRVEELARAARVRVDTVRFYQSRGLIPPPERRGRVAIYRESHLARLRRVRELNRQGISLDAIRRLLREPDAGSASPVAATPPPASGPSTEAPGPASGGAGSTAASQEDRRVTPRLLEALEKLEGGASYSEEELAAASGFPSFLLASLRELGLLEPREGEPRYTEADREALEAARRVLEAGIPLSELLPLAREHAEHIERVAERAIDLFEAHVRRRSSDDPPEPAAVANAFRTLLPGVTTLVAQHFQRVLLRRARARLSGEEGDAALSEVIDSTPSGRLHVAWR